MQKAYSLKISRSYAGEVEGLRRRDDEENQRDEGYRVNPTRRSSARIEPIHFCTIKAHRRRNTETVGRRMERGFMASF